MATKEKVVPPPEGSSLIFVKQSTSRIISPDHPNAFHFKVINQANK